MLGLDGNTRSHRCECLYDEFLSNKETPIATVKYFVTSLGVTRTKFAFLHFGRDFISVKWFIDLFSLMSREALCGA